MIIENELGKTKRLLSGHCAYFDPCCNTNVEESIRILPLLIDKTLIYLNKNNVEHKSIIENCMDLISETIFIPVSISETNLPDNIPSKNCVFRNRILDESLFTIEYGKLIQKDYDDLYLKDLVKKKISNKKFGITFNETVYSLNWDVIFSQIIETPLILDSDFRNIFSYKCEKLVKSYYYPQSLNHLTKIKNFISKINPVFPVGLDIDKIKQFRKERVVIQFRNWLETSIYDVYFKQKYGEIPVDEYLVKEFNKISSSYTDKANLISYSLCGAIGAIVGLQAGSITTTGIAGAIGTAAGYPFSKLLRKIWKRNGPNPWVFLLSDSD